MKHPDSITKVSPGRRGGKTQKGNEVVAGPPVGTLTVPRRETLAGWARQQDRECWEIGELGMYFKE